jgi:cysteine-rich repeat protein
MTIRKFVSVVIVGLGTVTACGAEADYDPAEEPVAEERAELRSVCGNGRLESGEQCDDGNRRNNDACTNWCKLARCGDGILGPGEQCDDGNTNNGDACTNACRSRRAP